MATLPNYYLIINLGSFWFVTNVSWYPTIEFSNALITSLNLLHVCFRLHKSFIFKYLNMQIKISVDKSDNDKESIIKLVYCRYILVSLVYFSHVMFRGYVLCIKVMFTGPIFIIQDINE